MPLSDEGADEELVSHVPGVRMVSGELHGVASELFAMLAEDDPESFHKSLLDFRKTHSTTELADMVNLLSKDGRSLLMAASQHGYDTVVRLLLDSGADPNLLGPDGRTALDYSSDSGYFSLGRDLIDGGADPSISEVFKKIFSNDNEYAGERTEAVDQVAAQTIVDPTQLGPLSKAVFEGDDAMVKKLVGDGQTGPSGCDIEEGADRGEASFLLASTMGHWNIMETLLSCGANINTTSRLGWTPLMLAARRNDEHCVSLLLKHGADANHLSPDRWTALAEATSAGHPNIVRMLLEAGADPEPRSQHDWTPLMHAAYRGDIDAVNLLMSHGASFEEISARDETVMLLAAAKGSLNVVERLLDAGCAPESEWSKVQREDLIPELNESLKPQQRIERIYKVGWTPLMVACQIGSLEIVRRLLDAGANPQARSPMFKTALEIAKENGRVEIVSYLEERLGMS
jgi:ankyrin repeat protein